MTKTEIDLVKLAAKEVPSRCMLVLHLNDGDVSARNGHLFHMVLSISSLYILNIQQLNGSYLLSTRYIVRLPLVSRPSMYRHLSANHL
jgi:hypothetical protein